MLGRAPFYKYIGNSEYFKYINIGIEVLRGRRYYKEIILQQYRGIKMPLIIKSRMSLSRGIKVPLTIRSRTGLSRGIRAPLTIKSRIGLSRGIRTPLTIKSKIGFSGGMA